MMFKTLGDAINKHQELKDLVQDIDSSLKKIRGERFLQDIEKDKRPTVQMMYKAREDATTDIAILMNVEIVAK